MIRRACSFTLVALLAASAAAQDADSAAYSKKPEFRLGASLMSTKRAASGLTGAVSTAQASIKGVETLARASGGSGLVVRYETGTLSGPSTSPATGNFEVLDSHFLLGERVFAIILGYTLRKTAFNGNDKRLGLGRAGVAIGRFFPGAGVEVSLSGSYVRSPQEDKADSLRADGVDGQTTVTYVPPRGPVYFQLGYRRETFNLRRSDEIVRREELSKLILTVGVQYGLSVR